MCAPVMYDMREQTWPASHDSDEDGSEGRSDHEGKDYATDLLDGWFNNRRVERIENPP